LENGSGNKRKIIGANRKNLEKIRKQGLHLAMRPLFILAKFT
jgi:hypothetical protein